jgi:hypothetical protein
VVSYVACYELRSGARRLVLSGTIADVRQSVGEGAAALTTVLDMDAAHASRSPTSQTGPYAAPAATDTGVGIDPKRQARIFDRDDGR